MALQKIEKQNVGDMVFEQLKDSIMSGEWKPGEKMPSENELVGILGVSRISVRSALQRLSGLGLIESRRGEGTFVRKFYSTDGLKAVIPVIAMSAHDRQSLFEFRRIIEVEAAALAAERADDKILTGMDEANRGMESPETAAAADLAFHNMVAKASCNPFIISVSEILRDYYFALFKDNATVPNTNGLEEHEQLMDAFRAKDPDRAREIMREHLIVSQANWEQLYGDKK
jgi:GntR family transcriptional repressor for pyruvate dehydrogenase complex